MAYAGIQDAIQKTYLKTMHFGVASDPEGTVLLEVGCMPSDRQPGHKMPAQAIMFTQSMPLLKLLL